MLAFPIALQRLIKELGRLPSIGEKTATRLAYHLVNNDRQLGENLMVAIEKALAEVKFCNTCFFLSERESCSICEDHSRDKSLLCVVEKPVDLVAIERVGEFKGTYHVLHGLWAPLRGLGPDSMKLAELVERIKNSTITEVILATGSTVEGDATALYISKILSEMNIRSTRLAQGLPKGGELEFTDDLTLSRAFSGRSAI